MDVLSPFFVRDIDETSWKSLSGVRANQRIIQLVPDLEVIFESSHGLQFYLLSNA